jgi:hypothetical protein
MTGEAKSDKKDETKERAPSIDITAPENNDTVAIPFSAAGTYGARAAERDVVTVVVLLLYPGGSSPGAVTQNTNTWTAQFTNPVPNGGATLVARLMNGDQTVAGPTAISLTVNTPAHGGPG